VAPDQDQQLVDLLDEVWSSMAALGAELSESEWKTATDVPGWSVQDNFAHIEGMEQRLLGRPAPDHQVPDDLPHVKNDIGAGNEVFVDARRSHAGADVLAEFREVTAERIAQLRAFTPADFARESWTPVGPGTVRDLLPFRIFDSWVHEQDMRRAVGKPGNFDSSIAAVSFDRIVDAMPFVVGKKASAPDGATVVFELSGPLGRTFAIGVEGGRAKMLDAVPSAPSVRVVTDTETFARLGCGRVAAAGALRDATVRLEGDEALGRTVVEAMNFLF
jgi:uncharacterized protein (TIGR03083 family)